MASSEREREKRERRERERKRVSLMVAAVGGGVELMRYTQPVDHDFLAATGAKIGLQATLAIVQLLDQAVGRMRQSVHSRILLEAAIVQICYLPDLQRVADLTAAVTAVGTAQTGSRSVAKKKTLK